MIDKKRIEEEAAHFFQWPDPKDKAFVTTASCLIFAGVIAEMVRAEERERLLRGEFICGRCGLRKNAESGDAAPF